MRENIGLYRGKRKDNGEWVRGFLCKKYFQEFPHDRYVIQYETKYDSKMWKPDYMVAEVTPATVGACSLVPDKNGKLIFEGDICKHRSNYSGNFIISVVTYADGCFLAMADNNSGFNLSDKLEVIGNIHDNPELLQNT